MPSLAEGQLVSFLVALVSIIVLARLGGELARRNGQPEVLGQLVAGVLLGPSVLGLASPGAEHWLLGGSRSGYALSGASWLGALLVLFAAGMEVDLHVVRAHARVGLLAAFCAIAPSFAAGTAFGLLALHYGGTNAAYLGIVLSVTAISVVSAAMIEWGWTRREFAQVILAGGIAAEVSVWIWVSVAGASRHGSPLPAGLRTLAIAILFFVGTIAARRFVNRATRFVADRSVMIGGPLTLVLVLMIGFSAVTQLLGLHALLGAFVAGVLLAKAPRTNAVLLDRLAALTKSVFAPVFFALAGAQVDLREIASLGALGSVVELLAVATVVKIGVVALGARIGGFRGARTWLVGAGLNAKGGTDVVVAIVGHELGLLPSRAYTSYTVVAIITVLFTPVLMQGLERRTPPSGAEEERLAREEAAARAYTSRVERILLPCVDALRPALALDVVEGLSLADERRLRTLDVTQLRPARHVAPDAPRALDDALASSTVLRSGRGIEPLAARADDDRALADGIVAAASRHDLVVIGAEAAGEPNVFGPLADAVVHRSPSDVLVAVGRGVERLSWPTVRRIVVPTNGLAHASAAADLAGLLAQQVDAEVVLVHVAPALKQHAASAAHLDDLQDLLRRLDVRVTIRIRRGTDPVREVVRELRVPIDGNGGDLIVIGAVDRGRGARPFLGHTVEGLLADAPVPMAVLVTDRRAAVLAPAA